MVKVYYSLTKSGLIYGNLITVIGGFALGAASAASGAGTTVINLSQLFATLVGISLVMASGCVLNNYIDRDIDAKMPRTKERALVVGQISGRAAITFAIMLGLTGFAILAFFTNAIAFAIAAFGFFAYIILYTILAKRRTIHGALVGSLSGATPPVVGYTAASGQLDLAALILFVTMICWQMPHFYAIAIRRAGDYAAGDIPVLPGKRGIRATKIAMLGYIIVFIIAASLLKVAGYTGEVYFTIVLILGMAWLLLCLRGFFIKDSRPETASENKRWALKMFFFSLIVMVTFFITIALGAIV